MCVLSVTIFALSACGCSPVNQIRNEPETNFEFGEPLGIVERFESDYGPWRKLCADRLTAPYGIGGRFDPFSPRNSPTKFDDLSRADQVLAALSSFNLATESGDDFIKYLYYDCGDYYPEFVQALRTIGATRAASIAARAEQVFPNASYIEDREARQHYLESIWAVETNRDSIPGDSKAAILESIMPDLIKNSENYFDLAISFASDSSG